MKKTIINTTNAPAALGPYEQAIKVGDIVYTSGQIGLNSNGELVSENVAEQTEQVMKNLVAVLDKAGTCLDNAIKMTIFIKNMDDFTTINDVYKKYFSTSLPARSCVEVARLPKDVLVEIEAIAHI